MFQYYIFVRMINPQLFGPLSPDFYGSTEPYKVIIRQVGRESMVAYFLETGEALKTTKVIDDFLLHFNPKTTLYLYEPWLDVVNSPFLCKGMPSISTVSPNNNRYKELSKVSGFRFLHFPLWKEYELQAVAGYIRQLKSSSEDILKFFSHDKVKERFDEFGGNNFINFLFYFIFMYFQFILIFPCRNSKKCPS